MIEDEWEYYTNRFSEEQDDVRLEADLRTMLSATPSEVDARVLLSEILSARARDCYNDNRQRANQLLHDSNCLLEQAIDISPKWERKDCDSCYTKVALNSLLLEDPMKVVNIAEQGLSHFPKDYSLATLLCSSYNNLGNYAEAIKISERFRKLCQDDPNPELDTTVVDENDNELYKTRDSIMGALLIAQGDALFGLGRKTEARQLYREVEKLCGKDDALTKKIRSCNQSSPLITLFELKCLGKFIRYQDREQFFDAASLNAPLGYPLFETRLTPDKYVDLLVGAQWKKVEFVTCQDGYLYYRQDSCIEKISFSKYCVAPAGLYTAYKGDMSTISSATLSKYYKRNSGSFVTNAEVQSVALPYVTFRIEYADGRGSSGWDFETFHIADPRIEVPNVVPNYPFYNSPIGVSHRWFHKSDPDSEQRQVRELLKRCTEMNFHDCQTFFIDYCSLPQHPRTAEEEAIFRDQLPKMNRYFQESTIILTEGVSDYETRAWCMFELILSSIRNAILNKEALVGQLDEAFDLARSFVDVSIQNFEAKRRYGILPGKTISPSKLSKWLEGSMGLNRGYYEMEHHKKKSILEWFHKHDLKASNMEDIAIIVDLLDSLI